jgi:hypothetical protein
MLLQLLLQPHFFIPVATIKANSRQQLPGAGGEVAADAAATTFCSLVVESHTIQTNSQSMQKIERSWRLDRFIYSKRLT